MHLKYEQHLIYNLKIWNKKVAFDIINYISENVTLAQLMEKLVNVNHAISILRSWIFESNYEKSLCMAK